MKSGLQLIGEERERQRGPQFAFTESHDDAHTNGELVDLAEQHLHDADPTNIQQYGRNLAKAGAVIAAELDRVIRATGGTVTFAEANRGIHQTGGDPDNRDGSQANAQANEPVRTPVGRDDNKDGSLAGGNKPVVGDEGSDNETRRGTPGSTQRSSDADARTRTAAKRDAAAKTAARRSSVRKARFAATKKAAGTKARK